VAVEKILGTDMGDKKYWAKWTPKKPTVTFNYQGATGGTNLKNNTVTYDSTYGTLPNPTKTGYTFKGWYTAASGGSKVTSTSKVTNASNHTLYARWTAVSYTIAYSLDGGTVTGNPSTYTIESNAITLKNPTKTGYTFMGWYDNAAFNGTVITGVSAGSTGNKTFYAKWKINTYAITLSPGKGYSIEAVDSMNPVNYGGNYAFRVKTAPGYNASKMEVRVNGNIVSLNDINEYTISNITEDKTVTVEGVADTKAPGITIEMADQSWIDRLLDSSSPFGIFFKENQTITITATDEGSGIKKVWYYLANNGMTKESVKQIITWQEYKTPFSISEEDNYVICVKAEDNAGNITYADSEGFVLDKKAPQITGITNEEVYCESVKVTVTEVNLAANGVTINGTPVTLDANNSFTLTKAEGAKIIKVTDKAGNESSKTVTVSAHNFEERDITKNASCTESGIKERCCSRCDKKETETIPATGHTFPEQWTVEKEATENESGRQYKICENCSIKILQTIEPTGTVPDPYARKIDKEVDVLPGAPDTVLNNSRKELAENILTAEELAEVDNGADAKIWLEIGPDVDISETDKEQAQKAAEESVGAGAEITYFDASLFKQVGDGEKTIIHNPNKPVSVTIVIPEGIQNKNVLMLRNYQIIRLHNGKTDIIEGTYNEKSAEFTFETDKFSTYAICYKDVPKQPEPAGPVEPIEPAKTPTPMQEGSVEPGTPTPTPRRTAEPGTSSPTLEVTAGPGTPTLTLEGTAEPGTPTLTPEGTAEPGTPTLTPEGTTEPETPTSAPDESGQTGNEIEQRKDLSILLATGKQKGSNGITLTWLKWKGASGYELYWSYCDGKKNYKKLKTVNAAANRTYTHKKLKKNRAYKYYIATYKIVDGKKKYVAKSPTIHVAMNYEKYTNAKKITSNKAKAGLSLTNEKYKKIFEIKVKVKKENCKKKLLAHAAKLRYYTDDKKVARIDRTGKITAKGRGKCTVYVIANNGVCKKITVTVK